MAGPGVTRGTVPNACSLVDILPTFLDIAALSGTDKPPLGQPIDGRSLWPLATGQSDDRSEAIGEYCAEMAGHPVFMIRRGDLKYVHCDTDPPQLFDLAKDPAELTNRATDPDYAQAARAFAAEVTSRWDSAAIRRDVIATQVQRRAVNAAMEAGAAAHWDYTPPRDASREYVRNHMDWTVAAARFHVPLSEN